MRGQKRPGVGISFFLLIVIYGLYRLWLLSLRGAFIDYDETYYLIIARNIISGNGIRLNGLPHSVYSPVFPLAVALVSVLNHDVLHASRIVSAFSGAVFVLPLFFIFRRISNRRTAWLAIFITISIPQLNHLLPTYSRKKLFYMGSEPLYLLLLFSALAVLVSTWESRKPSGYFISGVLFGLSYMTRPESAITAATAVLVMGIFAAVRGTNEVKQLAFRVALLLAGVCIILAPFFIHLRISAGKWVIFNRGFPVEMKETALDVFREDRWDRDMRVRYSLDRSGCAMYLDQWGVEDRRKLPPENGFQVQVRPYSQRLWECAAFFVQQLHGVLFPVYLLPFAFLGLITWFISADSSRKRNAIRVFLPILCTSAGIVLSGYPMPRYQMILLPLLAFFSAGGVEAIKKMADRLNPPESRNRHSRAFAVLVVTLLTGTGFLFSSREAILHPPGQVKPGDPGFCGVDSMVYNAELDRRLGVEIQHIVPEGKSLMTWNPRLAWYANRSWRVIPIDAFYGDWTRVFHYAACRTANPCDFMALTVYGSPPGFRKVDKPLEIIDLQSLDPNAFASSRMQVILEKVTGNAAIYKVQQVRNGSVSKVQ